MQVEKNTLGLQPNDIENYIDEVNDENSRIIEDSEIVACLF